MGYAFDVEVLPHLIDIAPPEETGSTFEENATLKAAYYSRFTQELVFADDSGLEVDALAGDPGVFSARYAGPHATDSQNNQLLLANLSSHEERTALFVSVVAIAKQGHVLATARGTVEGEILAAARGTEGFGYDPVFFYPPFAQSFGEISAERKLTVSHRGRALRAALKKVFHQ